MKRLFGLFCLFLALGVCAQRSFAQIPRLLSYQGILTDTTGTPKPDGEYTLTFRLYDVKTGGSAIWTETKTVLVERGLFSTRLGDAVSFGASVMFDKSYWLSLQVGAQPELSPRIALSATAYSLNTPRADSARIAGTVPNNSISSAKIQNGTIQLAHLAQSGATDGQVLKWSGGSWTVAADATGGGGASGGWTDGGTVVGLTSAGDTVSINSTSHMGKLNVGGNIGLNSASKLYFGTTTAQLGSLAGNMSATAESFSFARDGEASWMRVDNAAKEVGIGTVTMADRLHIANETTTPCWVRIESSHPTTWGQTGLRIKTPQNMWNLRMDLYSNSNLPNGALSLHSQDANKEVMTWLEDGRVGIGIKAPIRKLHVNGSAEIKDTLYADAINAQSIVNGPGMVHVNSAIYQGIGDNWTLLDSITVQAPGTGYILILFTGSLSSNHDYNDETSVSLKISGDAQGSSDLASAFWRIDTQSPGGYYDVPAVMHAVDVVSSVGPQRYYIGGERVGSSATPDAIWMRTGYLTAVFIPAAYGTVEPSPGFAGIASQNSEQREKPRGAAESYESRLNALTSELQALKNELASRSK